MRSFALAIAAAAALLVGAGCNKSPGDPVIPPPAGQLPDSVPEANTPGNLLLRLESAWEHESISEIEGMLAGDFRFNFSVKSDPALVDQWGDNWRRDDEIAAASHLFTGYEDDEGLYQSPTSRILLAFMGVSILADPDHADSSAWYKLVIVSSFEGRIILADASQTEYEIGGGQDLYLVRGDAAVLAPGQEARTDQWYVTRWVDRAVSLGSPVILPARTKTWGSLHAQYR